MKLSFMPRRVLLIFLMLFSSVTPSILQLLRKHAHDVSLEIHLFSNPAFSSVHRGYISIEFSTKTARLAHAGNEGPVQTYAYAKVWTGPSMSRPV